MQLCKRHIFSIEIEIEYIPAYDLLADYTDTDLGVRLKS